MLRHVILNVLSVQRSCAFFEKLGMQITARHANDSLIELAPATQGEDAAPFRLALKETKEASEKWDNFQLSFQVSNLNEILPSLIMDGSTMVEPMRHLPNGVFVLLRSPDDLLVSLREG